MILGLRPKGASWSKAKREGFEVYTIPEASKKGDIIHTLIPDLAQPTVYRDYIAPYMNKGKTLFLNFTSAQIEHPRTRETARQRNLAIIIRLSSKDHLISLRRQ